MRQVLLAQVGRGERAAARAVDARVRGHTVQVLAGQQPLSQRAEGNAAHALGLQGVQQIFFHPAVHQAVGRLVNQQRHAHAAQNGGGFARFAGRVAGDTHVQRLALLHRRGQRAHGFFQRGVGVEAVGIEDVHVVQPHALQALVQAGQHVFARAATLAIRTRPHVPARLAGDDEFVPVGSKVAPQVFTKIGFGAAGRRAVVVG